MVGLTLLALVLAVGLGVVLPVVRQRGQRAPGVPAAVAAVYRHTRRWQFAGLLAGVPIAVVVGGMPLGRGLLLAGPAFGLCVLGGVLIGETTAPRLDPGGTRTAVLEVRTMSDYLPTRLATVVASLGGGLLALLIVTTATAVSDDLGRAGRALTLTCQDGGVTTATPWPGSYYSILLAAMLIAGVAIAALGFYRVTLRPRLGADPEVRAADDYIRRRAGRRIVAACGVLVAVPTAGVAVVSGATLRSVSCGSGWTTAADWGLIALALLALGLLIRFAVDLADTTLSGPRLAEPA